MGSLTQAWRSGRTSALRYTFGTLSIWMDGCNETTPESNKGVGVARAEKRSLNWSWGHASKHRSLRGTSDMEREPSARAEAFPGGSQKAHAWTRQVRGTAGGGGGVTKT